MRAARDPNSDENGILYLLVQGTLVQGTLVYDGPTGAGPNVNHLKDSILGRP
jgi:hypothetical protein